MSLLLRQWEGHFGTAPDNYFSALGIGKDISNGSMTGATSVELSTASSSSVAVLAPSMRRALPFLRR